MSQADVIIYGLGILFTVYGAPFLIGLWFGFIMLAIYMMIK